MCLAKRTRTLRFGFALPNVDEDCLGQATTYVRIMKTDNLLPLIMDFSFDQATFKRVGLLVLAIVVAIFAISVWLSSHLTLRSHYQTQTRTIGIELSKQYQQLLSEPLAQQKTQQINGILSAFVSDPHVLSATVFDQHGRTLLQQPEIGQYSQFVYLHQTEANPPHTFVLPLRKDEKLLGYIRVLFTQELAKESMQQLEWAFVTRALLMMLLALLTGVILTRAFYKRRIRKLK